MSTSISFSQIAKGHNTLVEQGVTPEIWQKKFLEEGLLADVAEAVVKKTLSTDRKTLRRLFGLVKVYKIIVGYHLSLREMIIAGKYDWIGDVYNPDTDEITEESFPIAGEGMVALEGELIKLANPQTRPVLYLGWVLTQLDRLCLRPAKIEELLVFGATYPVEQIKSLGAILALGSFAMIGGKQRVAGLTSSVRGRGLRLVFPDEGVSDSCTFLAFPK